MRKIVCECDREVEEYLLEDGGHFCDCGRLLLPLRVSMR